MHRGLLAAVAASCLTLAGAAHAQVTVRYGQIANSARSVSSLPLYVAQRKGYFTRENIDLKIVGLRGVQYQIEELDKGNVEVSYTATPYLIEAVLKGSPAVGVIGGSANNIFSLMTKPAIKSYADLKGKVITLSLPVDTISIATRLLLDKHGVKDGTYQVKELVSSKLRGECLEKGDCDAVPMGQPDDIVFTKKGYTKLGDTLEVVPVLQFSVVAARRDWAQANRDTLLRVTRAFGDAFKFMRDPKNRDETVKIMNETTGAPPDVARAMLTFYYEPDRGVMPKQAEINMAGMTRVVELLGHSGKLKAPLPAADKFVDLQYLKAAGLQ